MEYRERKRVREGGLEVEHNLLLPLFLPCRASLDPSSSSSPSSSSFLASKEQIDRVK